MLEPFTKLAAELDVHLVVGSYERGPARGVVYNGAAVIGSSGDVLGVYRKTHPFGGERVDRGGWVTPGDDVLVVETELGRIGVIICFDGDYPELSRITALRGAEIICRPSALLRSADLWELTNRARAYDNHVYVIGANATGVDPSGVIYFGNSMIVTPIAEVIARAASHECWVSARLDPDDRDALAHPGVVDPAVVRPRRGAQHDPDPPQRRRPARRRGDVVPVRAQRRHRRLNASVGLRWLAEGDVDVLEALRPLRLGRCGVRAAVGAGEVDAVGERREQGARVQPVDPHDVGLDAEDRPRPR